MPTRPQSDELHGINDERLSDDRPSTVLFWALGATVVALFLSIAAVLYNLMGT